MTAARRTRARLRAALAGGLLALTGAAGCTQGVLPSAPEPLTLVGPWTGEEEEDFKEVLAEFTEEHGIEVIYEGTNATQELVLSSIQTGDPPDVAIQSGLGELADYHRRGLLKRLPDGIVQEGDYDPVWLPRPRGVTAHYWVPVKADLKSIVWHDRKNPPGDPAQPPDVSRWCIGMLSDATSGWPGSDWIEDILLQQAGPDVYDDWATRLLDWDDPRMVEAWETWGRFMRGQDGADGTGGTAGTAGAGSAAERALHTDHRGPDGKGGLLFDEGFPCELEHQGSFLPSLYDDDRVRARLAFTPSATPSSSLLPGAAPRGNYRQVAADFAVMLRDSPEARLLLTHLVGQETQRKRAQDLTPPGYSAHNGVTAEMYPEGDEVSRGIVTEMRRADRLCLDASDVMPPTIRRAFHDAVLHLLADPGQDLDTLLKEIQRAQEALPEDTPAFESVCS
ncbi:extracellular solute-binding protein [Streptomyces sp. YIM 98790]|uniref:extracellular solute-binding protein n=1 Tax=Streptomyces sp. YIM 98790 TaxID=2689077 RepID=UPI0014091132|nr:extracellular solute-binding protein [Streptomyces sp. YIM 98790]